MSTIKSCRLHSGGLAFLAACAAIAWATPASAQGSPEYAVKFVCGDAAPRTSFAPGTYFTAINIHNPGREDNGFAFKVALAKLGSPGNPTGFSSMVLKSDQATEFDCRLIRRLLGSAVTGTTAFTGFFVIQPRQFELDVVAVYSAGPVGGPVATMHTERVPLRMNR
ncbi:MAG: hypothetical protein QOJ27_2153 [Sphingomonadales bacterium]|jgi:hypothetical protein|nr:hypothetical protein [Sphingomonadales bacterium]